MKLNSIPNFLLSGICHNLLRRTTGELWLTMQSCLNIRTIPCVHADPGSFSQNFFRFTTFSYKSLNCVQKRKTKLRMKPFKGKIRNVSPTKILFLQFFVRDDIRTKIICMLKASQRIHIGCMEILCVRKVGGQQQSYSSSSINRFIDTTFRPGNSGLLRVYVQAF